MNSKENTPGYSNMQVSHSQPVNNYAGLQDKQDNNHVATMCSSPLMVPLVVKRLGIPKIPAIILEMMGGKGIPCLDRQVDEYRLNNNEDQDIEVRCNKRDNRTQQGGRGELDDEDEGTRETPSVHAHSGGANGDEAAVNPMDNQTEDDSCNPSDTEDEKGPAVS
ncbi:hypothetical protein PAXRUDRAFT_29127, partial [Paxillus rubicundulus Ve08.2h10]